MLHGSCLAAVAGVRQVLVLPRRRWCTCYREVAPTMARALSLLALGGLLAAPGVVVVFASADDPEAPHACEPCGDQGGCSADGGSSEACNVEWPSASTPGYDAKLPGQGYLGRGVDYVGGGDLGLKAVKSTEECCQLCLAHPTCKVWVTTDKPVSSCWLKSWPGGVITNKKPDAPQPDLRWSGLACECDATCRPVLAGAGMGFSTLALLSAALYLVGGSLFRKRSGATGWDMLPHRREWQHLHGLVRDGVAFSRSGGQSKKRRGGMAVEDSGGGRSSRDSGSGSGSLREPLGAGESKTKQQKKEKKGRDKKGSRSERTRASPSAEQPPPPPSSGPGGSSPPPAGGDGRAAASTAAVAGGRWVHIPS